MCVHQWQIVRQRSKNISSSKVVLGAQQILRCSRATLAPVSGGAECNRGARVNALPGQEELAVLANGASIGLGSMHQKSVIMGGEGREREIRERRRRRRPNHSNRSHTCSPAHDEVIAAGIAVAKGRSARTRPGVNAIRVANADRDARWAVGKNRRRENIRGNSNTRECAKQGVEWMERPARKASRIATHMDDEQERP